MAILLLHCRFSEDITEQGPQIINCSEFPNEPHELDEASKYRHVTFYFPSNDYKVIKIIMCINTLQKYLIARSLELACHFPNPTYQCERLFEKRC